MFINTLGTFGIASASYEWSRVASALGRIYHTSLAIEPSCGT